MFRSILLISALSAVPTAAAAQVLMPGGVKPVAKPVMPVMTVPVTPTTTAPVGPVSANRTIELLKAAGIVNPVNLERPVTLSARVPYIDDSTNLYFHNGDLFPTSVAMKGTTDLWLRWNPDPSKRYVVDCAFNSDGANVAFGWDRPVVGSSRVTVTGGHAGVVLPAGTETPIMIMASSPVQLTSCDITPFGS